MVSMPLVACVPVQAPLAVHDVAFVEDHVSVELCPSVIEVGLTDRVTVGEAAVTVNAAEARALPPVPLQVRV